MCSCLPRATRSYASHHTPSPPAGRAARQGSVLMQVAPTTVKIRCRRSSSQGASCLWLWRRNTHSLIQDELGGPPDVRARAVPLHTKGKFDVGERRSESVLTNSGVRIVSAYLDEGDDRTIGNVQRSVLDADEGPGIPDAARGHNCGGGMAGREAPGIAAGGNDRLESGTPQQRAGFSENPTLRRARRTKRDK